MNTLTGLSPIRSLRFFLPYPWLPPNVEADAEVADTEEVAPPPALDLQATHGHGGTRYMPAILSTFSTWLYSNAGLSPLGWGNGNLALPVTSRFPVPPAIQQDGPPSPLLPLQAWTTSPVNIGEEDLLLQVSSRLLQRRPNYPFHNYNNLQATHQRFNTTPIHLGSNSVLPCPVIGIDSPTRNQLQWQPAPSVSLAEIVISLSYQAMVALFVFHFQCTPDNKNSSTAKPPAGLLMAVEVAVVVGFAASLIGVLLREVCGKVAAAIRWVGSVMAALGFFLMMAMLFSTSISVGIGVLCGGASMMAFMLLIIKKKTY